MNEPKEDRLKSLRNRISAQNTTSTSKIQATSLEGRIIENLKLFKSLIRGERVRLNQFVSKDLSSESQKNSAVEKLKNKIIGEFLELELKELALIKIPKKLQEECYDLLVQAWRKKVYHEFSQTLTFLDLKFSKDSFKAFVIALSVSVSLRALRLDRCRLKADKIKLLAVFIKVHPSITVLHLDDNPMGDESFLSLASALAYNDTLLHLSCNKAKLTDESLPVIIELLNKGKLQTLSITHNDFSEESKDKLVDVAVENNCVITVED